MLLCLGRHLLKRHVQSHCLQIRPSKASRQCDDGGHLYRDVVKAMMLSLPCSCAKGWLAGYR